MFKTRAFDRHNLRTNKSRENEATVSALRTTAERLPSQTSIPGFKAETHPTQLIIACQLPLEDAAVPRLKAITKAGAFHRRRIGNAPIHPRTHLLA